MISVRTWDKIKDPEMVVASLVEKNPELFKEIGNAIKKKTKTGMSEEAATMQVMREHQGELQKLMK